MGVSEVRGTGVGSWPQDSTCSSCPMLTNMYIKYLILQRWRTSVMYLDNLVILPTVDKHLLSVVPLIDLEDT